MADHPILDLVFSSWRFGAITAACRLRVFTRLDARPASVPQLAQELNCVPRLLEALLDACVGMGLLCREGELYRNSHLGSAHLVEGRPLYLGHILEVQARALPRWDHLLRLVETGKTPVVPDDHEDEVPVFTMAMNDLGAFTEAEALARAIDLSECRTLVDVGCGSGLFAITLCRHNPRLEAILIDRESVLRITDPLVAASRVGDRIRTRADDMTTAAYGEGVDAVLLSDSLYSGPDTLQRVLASAHRALRPGGRAIVRGYYPDPGASESPFGAIFRLNLLLFDAERISPTSADMVRRLAEAGFRDVRRFAITERSTCFVGTR